MGEIDDDNGTENSTESAPKKVKWTFRDNWLVIVGAVLLSLATVSTSWCAYQSARWSGVQSIYFAESNAARTKASTYANIGAQYAAYDAIMTSDLTTLYFEQEWESLEFLLSHLVREEYVPVVKAWVNANPLVNPDAPRNPLEMPEYSNQALADSEALAESAQRKTDLAKDANQQSDNYVLLTVMFASVLFFAGISSKFTARWLQYFFLSFGTVIFLIGLTITLSQPIH